MSYLAYKWTNEWTNKPNNRIILVQSPLTTLGQETNQIVLFHSTPKHTVQDTMHAAFTNVTFCLLDPLTAGWKFLRCKFSAWSYVSGWSNWHGLWHDNQCLALPDYVMFAQQENTCFQYLLIQKERNAKRRRLNSLESRVRSMSM